MIGIRKKEESILLEFAKKHKDDKDLNTQKLLWNYAKTKHILPKRTAASMLQHYAKLRRKTDILNKTGKHFTELTDLSILHWDWCWENMKPKEPKNSEGAKVTKWEAVAQNEVVFRRNADEPSKVKYEEWYDFFENKDLK